MDNVDIFKPEGYYTTKNPIIWEQMGMRKFSIPVMFLGRAARRARGNRESTFMEEFAYRNEGRKHIDRLTGKAQSTTEWRQV